MTVVAIAVLQRDEHFLVGVRPVGVPLAGLHEFPGGKVRPGEAPGEAALRECREETGYEAELLHQWLVQVHKYDHGNVELHFFACRPVTEVSDAELAGKGFFWAARRELSQLRFPDGNAEMLALLIP
jgi:mutator protein MutT